MAQTTWEEGIVKVCLVRYLNLLPRNLRLFRHLAELYVTAAPDIKRVILRVLDSAVREIDINDPLLLDVIEKCPEVKRSTSICSIPGTVVYS